MTRLAKRLLGRRAGPGPAARALPPRVAPDFLLFLIRSSRDMSSAAPDILGLERGGSEEAADKIRVVKREELKGWGLEREIPDVVRESDQAGAIFSTYFLNLFLYCSLSNLNLSMFTYFQSDPSTLCLFLTSAEFPF